MTRRRNPAGTLRKRISTAQGDKHARPRFIEKPTAPTAPTSIDLEMACLKSMFRLAIAKGVLSRSQLLSIGARRRCRNGVRR
jgi:hypothetical protein